MDDQFLSLNGVGLGSGKWDINMWMEGSMSFGILKAQDGWKDDTHDLRWWQHSIIGEVAWFYMAIPDHLDGCKIHDYRFEIH